MNTSPALGLNVSHCPVPALAVNVIDLNFSTETGIVSQ